MVNSMASEMSSFPLSMALWPRRPLGFVRARPWYCNMHGIVHFRLGQQGSNTSSRQETCNERTNWSFSRHHSIVSHPQSRWPLIEIWNRGENELNRRAAEFHRNQPSKWMTMTKQSCPRPIPVGPAPTTKHSQGTISMARRSMYMLKSGSAFDNAAR
ncbi:hypothetical protein VFPPC_07355 [Pochonia chlamydosporia 170]|uniref:Uncharacterized protein n=1 Tax=Pochonia chlamydosporia 170 TaxID=1380566 RepID=A0A179F908_METCM|nr:hypothetical protein VFPPC_07355 [Pochonia chlamydosporia 170]OAQ61934.1 hypothetical protein VFPPC_07355 [Pochonia chlamydosporia 170]